jgi:glycosyltransferase involved in cell wall biosynthesis
MSHPQPSPETKSDKTNDIHCCPIRPVERLLAKDQELQVLLKGYQAESHRLGEQLTAIESSLAWAIARRLSRLGQGLAPRGSWRLACLRLGVRALRFWRREGAWAAFRVAIRKVGSRFRCSRQPCPGRRSSVLPEHATDALANQLFPVSAGPDRTGGASVPTERRFRVVFIVSDNSEEPSMRYRAYNIIEALALAKMESSFVPEKEVLARFSFILSHDLVILVRQMRTGVISQLIEAAQRLDLPVVYDIDDYIFEPWVLPYIEVYRGPFQAEALRQMVRRGDCLNHCDFFTGSTSYLVEKAESLAKKSFLLHNGLNAEQIRCSRQALERRAVSSPDSRVRIGYFSGSRSHQADFRVAYPALMALLRDEPWADLVIAGDFDFGEFPGLLPFLDQIELSPVCHWRKLPAKIAQIDINLIPLELTPFNEGKSNLKYYEAGILQIPSIASPTRILQESITHGHNGLLARTTEEWYSGLKQLISDFAGRVQMGKNAFHHVMQNYVPTVTAAEAVAAYREIIRIQRRKRGIAEHALSIVILLHEAGIDGTEVGRLFHEANEMASAGHAVTLLAQPDGRFASAAALKHYVADHFIKPLFAFQLGGEIPCCDVLMAADPRTADLVKAHEHRAHLTVSLIPHGGKLSDTVSSLQGPRAA